jgi:hypothetical protein
LIVVSLQRLYCCLLFFFNFFQYVKELSGVVRRRLLRIT